VTSENSNPSGATGSPSTERPFIAPSSPAAKLAERFEVLSILGQGGGSIVYKALDRNRDNLTVAIKLLINENAFDEHVLERFREEVRICQSLNHPNLVKAYDLIEFEGSIGYTMECITGDDLSSVLRKGKPTPEVVDSIMDQLLAALDELHRNGIVHRDVKLENLMLREDGVVKLTDLGLIKSPELAGLTKTGILLGTAQYMPPEYVKHSVYDERGDLYAAGCVLYELLTGHRRLIDKPGMEALEHLIRTKFQVSRATLNGFHRRFIPLIERAMAVDPRQRFQTASEMRLAFAESANRERVGGGAVEMKSSLSSPSALRRLAAQQVEHRAQKGQHALTHTAFKAMGIASVVLLLIVTGAYQARSAREAQSSMIELGMYDGEAVGLVKDGLQNKVSVEIVNGNSAVFRSDIKDCTRATFNLRGGSLGCGSALSIKMLEHGITPGGDPYLVMQAVPADKRPPITLKLQRSKR